MNKLQEAISHTVKLGHPNATGFCAVRCAVCKDYKKRGGFRFESDGSVIYNCFRGKCDANAIWHPGEKLTHKFKTLMAAFGVEIPLEVLTVSTLNAPAAKTFDTTLYTEHHYQTETIPAGVERYDSTKHPLVKQFLESRSLSGTDYYVGVHGYWMSRLLTPFREGTRLIGWEARSLFNNPRIPRYEKSHLNQHLLYLPDGQIPETPILVEGVFDAQSVPFGVATLQSTISPEQAYLLRDVNPILLPDRVGSRFMDVAEKYGWKMIVPQYKEKDANEAVRRMGRVALAMELRENVCSDFAEMRLRYQLWTGKKI